ncbi:MAG: hypothetical protein ACLVKK_07285 [Ruthenibacterium sp.]
MVWNWYRRKMEAAFLLFICLGSFAACGTPQSEPQSAPCPTPAASAAPPDYSFAVPAEQCAVCGTCPQLAISALWGHENIAFLDLNTFDVLELPINRYAPRGPLLEQPAGFSAVVSANLGGASLTFLAAPDRGMASGWLEWQAPARGGPRVVAALAQRKPAAVPGRVKGLSLSVLFAAGWYSMSKDAAHNEKNCLREAGQVMPEAEYSVPLERPAGSTPLQGLRKPPALPGSLTLQPAGKENAAPALCRGGVSQGVRPCGLF